MERRHHQRAAVVLLICSCLLFAGSARAEDSSPPDAGFEWGGAIETGYRFTDIHGSGDRYREVVNLEEGLRLFDLSLWMKDLERKGIADEVRLRVNSIGDPFPSVRLDMKKNNIYQFSADYREHDFFFNRQDAPNNLLTDNHDFDQKRRIGRFMLSLFPADDIRLNFGCNIAERTGENVVPRAFTTVPGLTQNVDEKFREYFGSIDFPVGDWNIHIKQSVWTFDNENEIDQLIEPGLPRISEKRDESVWTYVSTIKAHTRLGDRWDFDAGYVSAHSEGDSQLNDLGSIPIAVRPGNGNFTFDTHIVELGLSHLLRKDLILHLDYRLHTFDEEGVTTTDLQEPTRVTETDYSLFAHTGTSQLEYTPLDNLTLRGGYRVQYRQIEAENFAIEPFDGGPVPAESGFFPMVGSRPLTGSPSSL